MGSLRLLSSKTEQDKDHGGTPKRWSEAKVGSPRTAGVNLEPIFLSYSEHVTWCSRCFLATAGGQARPGLEKRLYLLSASVEFTSPHDLSRLGDRLQPSP